MIKISDLMIKYIEQQGIKDVFFLPGGGAMHINDSIGKSENVNGICMLHEQACAIAAEAYARISEGMSCCIVTSGPGVTNTITGLAGAYLDSTPVLFISGQAKRADLVNNQNIRQFGIQEINAVELVKPITKYAVQIGKLEDILYEFEKATSIALQGRPGPVWIDVPLDIQASMVEEEALRHYENTENINYICSDDDITKVIEQIKKAKRPLLLIGNGIRLSGAKDEIRELYNYLGVPVLTTWNGIDLIEDNHPLFFGRPGAVGHRHSNFIQQNADLVISIGTRLNLLSTGYNFESFLKNAYHIMVDIDENEMHKISVNPELPIRCDAKGFIVKLLESLKKEEVSITCKNWLEHCKQLKAKYPLRIKEQLYENKYISTYDLAEEVSNQLTSEDIFQFTSSGTGADICMQMFRIKKGQRAFLTKGLAAMGYDLPASIGSCIASGKRRTVCITGDGGFMMNIQELATLKKQDLPVKIFIIDNEGYGMIYGSQNGNFQGRLTGCNDQSGLPVSKINSISEAFGIKSFRIEELDELSEKITEVLAYDGPTVCTVRVDIAQRILPRQTNYMKEDGQMASRPLEDMSPLLDRAEFELNLI